MNQKYISTLIKRRSIYHINNEVESHEHIINDIKEITTLVPSPFNIQSGRVVMLFGENHTKLWGIVLETLRKIVPEASFPQTEKKIKGFEAGHGTILFFEDTPTVDAIKAKFPLYKENFDRWVVEENGMLQISIWNYLANIGLGASLQHYNPLIDEEVKKTFKLPTEWRLVAQMPFGKILTPAGEKTSLPIQERVRVLE